MFAFQKLKKFIVVLFYVTFLFVLSKGLLRRCYQCRSRGELGSCKDPFRFNVTDVEQEPGVLAIPCASGWCGKVIEGGGSYRIDDFDQASQRMCLQRGPNDNEDRCAQTVYKSQKVFMCFCQGDLCNSSNLNSHSNITILLAIIGIFILKNTINKLYLD